MNRLELYGLGLLALLLITLGAYAKGHHVGYVAAEAKMEAKVANANAKIDQLQDERAAAVRESAQKYEDERTRHESELALARSSVSDRLCRRTPDPVKVPQGGTTSAGTPATPQGNAVPSGAADGDEWRYAFVAACQHDSDALAGWISWWNTQANVAQ